MMNLDQKEQAIGGYYNVQSADTGKYIVNDICIYMIKQLCCDEEESKRKSNNCA